MARACLTGLPIASTVALAKRSVQPIPSLSASAGAADKPPSGRVAVEPRYVFGADILSDAAFEIK